LPRPADAEEGDDDDAEDEELLIDLLIEDGGRVVADVLEVDAVKVEGGGEVSVLRGHRRARFWRGRPTLLTCPSMCHCAASTLTSQGDPEYVCVYACMHVCVCACVYTHMNMYTYINNGVAMETYPEDQVRR